MAKLLGHSDFTLKRSRNNTKLKSPNRSSEIRNGFERTQKAPKNLPSG